MALKQGEVYKCPTQTAAVRSQLQEEPLRAKAAI
jgi:hypothetical protein